ncbi:MAG: transaldolase [Neisseriaceae bacterium]
MASRLLAIKNFGQKIWLDYLSRELINSNGLQKLINDDGIAGITSNPTIFHKAISSDKSYQHDLEKLKSSNLNAEERYEALVLPDIKMACDIMLPLYNESNYEDGYISFEVSPHLANDAAETIKQAKRLWQEINRPNLMIKVPATEAGMIALTELIYSGININITLLFSLDQVVETWKAYISGLQKRHKEKLPLNKIKSVASFFLSRVDSIIDPQLPENLQGKTAINLAKTAYLIYQEVFSSSIFLPLKNAGAHNQYLLWASTGTKNPKYSDLLYIEELIGMETINTVPTATLQAFKDHGNARSQLTKDIEKAPKFIEEIKKYVNMTKIGKQLQLDGLKLFEQSYDELMNLVK